MTPRSFLGLAIATAIVAVAALIAVAVRHYGTAPTVKGETLLFPGLAGKIGEVAEIQIRSHEGVMTIRKSGDGWVLAEKGGYPVRDERVRAAVVGLGELQLVEPKTRMPELFARLEVEDIEAEGAKSKLLTLKDGAGETLAEVIVGKRRFSYSIAGQSGIYVRLPDERQSWLASGEFGVPPKAQSWLRLEVIDISEDRVARVSLVQPDGTALTGSKASPEDENFIIENLPEDAELISATAPNELASALSGFQLADVAPESEIAFPADGLSKAEIRTFGGLVVTVEMTEKDDATWARFSAAVADDSSAPGENIAAEAEEITSRVKGWAYKLKGYQARNLKRTLDDFLQGEEEEEMDEDMGLGGLGGALGLPPF